MQATEKSVRTHCSVCGQKVVRQDMPYCIYCGNHFELMEAGGAEAKKRKETRNMARLAKMAEHADYAETMAAKPGEGQEFDRWRRNTRTGLVTAGLGAALCAGSLAFGWGVVLAVLGGLAAAAGLWLAAVHMGLQRKRLALPRMAREVVVTDRRSETELRFNTGITTYFFTFEFADGNEAEFRYPGRGAHTEPLSKGVSGIAYTRGAELIDFKTIRV